LAAGYFGDKVKVYSLQDGISYFLNAHKTQEF